jgi:hypothetical protein
LNPSSNNDEYESLNRNRLSVLKNALTGRKRAEMVLDGMLPFKRLGNGIFIE